MKRNYIIYLTKNSWKKWKYHWVIGLSTYFLIIHNKIKVKGNNGKIRKWHDEWNIEQKCWVYITTIYNGNLEQSTYMWNLGKLFLLKFNYFK